MNLFLFRKFLVGLAIICFVEAVSAEATEERPATMFNKAERPTSEQVNSKFNIEDWLALPEVFSKLDFTADSTPAAPDDIEGQIKLRNSRYWGRMYVEGHPQPIQYFRAHFGADPPLGKKHFVFAEPRDGCGALTLPSIVTAEGAAVAPADVVVLVHRGTCSFGIKANHAHDAGVSALVIVNNEPGLEHHPSPDAHDIELAVSSIAQPEGQLLEAMFDSAMSEADAKTPVVSPLTGALVPINCAASGTNCGPATVQETQFVEGMSHGGKVTLHRNGVAVSGSADLESMEYLLAHFGIKVPSSGKRLQLAMSNPAEACDDLITASSGAGAGTDYKGKVVLVRRGGCPFVRKAEMVQAAGGAVMLVGSKHPYLVRMGVEPRWKGLGVAIPIAMVSKHTYSALFAEAVTAKAGGGSLVEVSFNEHHNVTGAGWEGLENLYNGQGWPRSTPYAKKRYEELKTANSAWMDRVHTLDEAFAKNYPDAAASATASKSEL